MSHSETDAVENEADSLLRSAIRERLRAGYDDDDEVLSGALDYAGDEFEVDEKRGRIILDEELAALHEEMLSWPATTDCDRLDAAFAELERAGIVARANFTCCSNCGESEIGNEMDEAVKQGTSVRGYTFFHQQDTDRAAAGDGGVLLKYGPNPFDENEVVRIGRQIQHIVERNGLRTEWDGSANRCIEVLLAWKRRRGSSGAPPVQSSRPAGDDVSSENGGSPVLRPPRASAAGAPSPTVGPCPVCNGKGWVASDDPASFPEPCACRR
jgi:hypothetical protein